MPRIKFTKSAIDSISTPDKDVVYWDTGCPGFGLKVTPKGRKVFLVLYRTAGAGSRLRKYTIGPYGRVTLHQAKLAAQKIFTARLEGRDPAGEKREAKRRITADCISDLLESYISQHVSQRRSAGELSRLLRRELGSAWDDRSIHEITKRDVIELVTGIVQRGAPIAANKTLKVVKTFLRWCVGRGILDKSPADGVPLPTKEVSRDRILSDQELARVILAAREIGGTYGAVVELLALTGQRREEVARSTPDEFNISQRTWTIPKARTKNGKAHIVHLSMQSLAVLRACEKRGCYVFSPPGTKPLTFSRAKRRLDELSGVTGWRLHDLRRTCVSGMARLGIPPHIADKILNHQSGTISGVAAVYQRHEFLAERREALEEWGSHFSRIIEAGKRRELKQAA